MSAGDLIYCYTCGGITIDNTNHKLQDSRYNSNWVDRCVHCLSFRTVNATQFLEGNKTEITRPIAKSRNLVALRAEGKRLVEQGIIKEFRINNNRPVCVLYERRRVRRELQKAIKQWELGVKTKL
jgi:hypothetical protein